MPDTRFPGACIFRDRSPCFVRICTRDLSFDEVACNRHVKGLYARADAEIPKGVRRLHQTKAGAPAFRGEDVRDLIGDLEFLDEFDR